MADAGVRAAQGRRALSAAARSWFTDRIALAVALPVFAVHAAFAGRYDFFRDELYFIVCGMHPSFGYVDQPPLVPLLAAALYGAGHSVWLLRLPCVLAAALLVVLVVRFVRLLGGGDGAAVAAALAAACAPMLVGISGTLNTTIFEPLAWTAVAYALARAVLLDDRRALLWAGLVAGLALEAKYALVTWLVALLAGVALTPQRSLLARRELWAGVAIAAALALPSVLWQAAHGFPFAELVAAAGDKNAAVAPPLFVLNQILVMNPLFAPLWIAGIVAPFVRRDLAPMRFLGIAYAAVLALNLAGHGKDYYVAAAYPALFAVGAIAFERVVRSALARGVVLAAAVALSAIAVPTSLAILDPVSLQAYIARFHLASQQQEKSFAGTALPQNFADQLGWRDFVREVGTAYASLPPDVRAHTAILVANYGEASALDLYGAPFGLPPALSPHNQFYLWGLRGQTPSRILRVTRDPGGLRAHCGGVRVFGTTFSRWAMSYENGKTIALCTRPAPRLADWWPELKNFS